MPAPAGEVSPGRLRPGRLPPRNSARCPAHVPVAARGSSAHLSAAAPEPAGCFSGRCREPGQTAHCSRARRDSRRPHLLRSSVSNLAAAGFALESSLSCCSRIFPLPCLCSFLQQGLPYSSWPGSPCLPACLIITSSLTKFLLKPVHFALPVAIASRIPSQRPKLSCFALVPCPFH